MVDDEDVGGGIDDAKLLAGELDEVTVKSPLVDDTTDETAGSEAGGGMVGDAEDSGNADDDVATDELDGDARLEELAMEEDVKMVELSAEEELEAVELVELAELVETTALEDALGASGEKR